VVDFGAQAMRLGREHSLLVPAVHAPGLDVTIDDLVSAQLESCVVEKAEHGVIFPRSLRAHLENLQLARFGLQGAEQRIPVAVPLFARPHADHFQPQCRFDAAEFPLQPAREHIALEHAALFRRELRVDRRRVQCCLQPPLEIIAARAAGDLRVDFDHCVQVLRGEAPQLHTGNGTSLCTLRHGISPVSTPPRRPSR
jgi:hypothetical protein